MLGHVELLDQFGRAPGVLESLAGVLSFAVLETLAEGSRFVHEPNVGSPTFRSGSGSDGYALAAPL